MDRLVVKGGQSLRGEVQVSGAKNSALKLIFASLLAEGEHVFRNVPALKDVESACLLIQSLGCETHFQNGTLRIKVPQITNYEASYDLVRKMRASILCLGPLLSKYGFAQVSLPGGCAIGTRPIDLHIAAMKALGAQIEIKDGYVVARAKKLKGSNFLFETSTVGGTENMLMAAALADGVTTLENAAKEPEIIDLVNYLKMMGARISGEGTSVIQVTGIDRLKPAEFTVMPDRIEAGTLLIAGAITKSEIHVSCLEPGHLETVLTKLKDCGFSFHVEKNAITILQNKSAEFVWNAVDVTTQPYPLFPTDLQAQFMALMTLAEGTSVITETVFENRFMHVQELIRLGADISPKTRVAVIRGKKILNGAPVMATDLRASASLVLAGLAAQGETIINRIYHLDRGYEKFEKKLSMLGAHVVRTSGSD